MGTQAKEGILVANPSGGAKLSVVSLSEVEVLDCLSQGPISGLVDREYIYSGTLGNIGWDSYSESIYSNPPGATDGKWLKSVYWNGVPIINSANQYNYQRVSLSNGVGNPNGEILYAGTPELTVSRGINERLRATDLVDSGDQKVPAGYDKDFTKYYRIYNPDCKAVIVNVKVARLSLTDEKNGDVNTTSVDYKIFYKPVFTNANKLWSDGSFNADGYSPPKAVNIEGKLQSPYIRSTRIDFSNGPKVEKDFLGWEIKIIRTTPESKSVYLSNQTYIDSISEIYEDVFSYPNVAIVRSNFSAEFFAQVPERSFDVRLLKVKVPKNYDPIKKTYATSGPGTTNGFWNGEFSEELKWTDNPAWCFYDLLTNKRYGLGSNIDEAYVDKMSLYKIAQYCDTLVSDGYGGLEPRFTCNLILYSREEAYKVINDMASMFNGMTYYSNSFIYVSQDSPKDPITYFTNENVENGNFRYEGTSKKSRNTVALVRYNDPKNFYEPAIEYVKDVEGIRKYGHREVEFSAFGCTSRGQATRQGLWMLNSQLRETESVSFMAGTEGSYLKPGDIIGIFDKNRKAYKNSGRLISISNPTSTTTRVVLDNQITIDNTSKQYKFTLITPSYYYDPSQVSDLNSGDIENIRKEIIQEINFSYSDTSVNSDGRTEILLNSVFNTDGYIVSKNAVWTIIQDVDLDDVDNNDEYNKSIDEDYDLYRVIRISEDEDKYQISAIQYYKDKFSLIDQGLAYERSEASINKIPDPPSELKLSVYNVTDNTKYIKCVISAPTSRAGLSSYKVFISQDPFAAAFGSDVPDIEFLKETVQISSNTVSTYLPILGGTYYYRVYGYNDEAKIYSSSYIERSISITKPQPIKDVLIGSLTVDNYTGTVNTNEYSVQTLQAGEINPKFTWQAGLAQDAQPSNKVFYRATYRPTSSSSSFPSAQIYHEQTGLTVPVTTFDFSINSALSGGPYRNYEVVIEAHDESFTTSAGNTIAYTDSSNVYTPIKENGWGSNPQGFARIAVSGLTIPAITLNSTTGNFGSYYDSGKSAQYIDLNGGIMYLFGANTIPTGIIGGYIYGSTGNFSGYDITTFSDKVVCRGFEFNPIERYAYAPAVFPPFGNFITGWTAISLFDNFDYQMILKNQNYRTGLPLSNTVSIFATGLAHTIEIKNKISFVNQRQFSDTVDMKIQNISGSGTYNMLITQSNRDVILFSRKA